ncbi:DUF4232 domain-containing protein [Streptomyces sp. HSW2009]|uniref:DUF4232 domain-containing protein n=1 Tax=Streptomyces sp. HSW2009 TaxID=3142890 RepID=UPI0032ECE03C
MRTSRTRIAAVAGVTTAMTLGLAAYAFADSGNGAQTSRGPAPRATVAAQLPGADQAQGKVHQVSVASAKQKSKAVTSKSTTKSVRQCAGDEISYDVLHRFPKQLGEHLLVTAMNADSTPCWVTGSPSVMLGDTIKVLPHSKKDAPGGKSKIVLKPGAKVYSAVNLFADGKKTRTSTELSLALRDQTGDTGPAVELNAFTSKGAVSKFTWSDADVTNWNTAKPYDF